MQNELIRSYLKFEQLANVITFILPTIFAFVIFFFTLVQAKQADDPDDPNDGWRQQINEQSSYLVLTAISIMKQPIA